MIGSVGCVDPFLFLLVFLLFSFFRSLVALPTLTIARFDDGPPQMFLHCITENTGVNTLPRQSEQKALDQVRGYMLMVREASIRAAPRANPYFLIENIWEAVMGCYTNLTHTLDRPLPPAVASGLRHRILIHRTLHERAVKADYGAERDAARDISGKAAMEIRYYVEREVPDSMAAARIVRQHLLTFVPEDDKDIALGLPTPSEDPKLYGL
jgi:hypothetical protein